MSTATDDFAKLTHGNYHAWAPRMTAELQRLGVWRFCTGDESIPAKKPSWYEQVVQPQISGGSCTGGLSNLGKCRGYDQLHFVLPEPLRARKL